MYYPGLQCLRAMAAILVLWAHLKFSAPSVQSQWVTTAAGAVGVDIFFVISGFVIAYSAEKSGYRWGNFLLSRVLRVAPLYWILLVPFILLGFYRGGVNWGALWNSCFFLPLLDLNAYVNPYHPYGWTLSFEFLFYVFFSVLMAVSGSRASWVLVTVFVVGCVLINCLYSGSWFFPRFAFHPLVLEFCAGILLYKASPSLTVRSAWVFGGLLPLFMYGVGVTERLGFHNSVLADPVLGLKRAILWGGLGVCITGLVVALDNARIVHWPKGLRRLGDASYSLYLLQPFSMYLAKLVRIYSNSEALAAIMFVVLSIGGALLLFRHLESRITPWLKAMVLSKQMHPSPQNG